jgi:hypothetical protein
MVMSGQKRWIDAHRTSLAVVIVALVVVGSVVFIYYSPQYSWSTTYRDHDGDGVADRSDPFPHDPSIWGLGVGFVNLTIRNNASEENQFLIFAGSSKMTENLTYDLLAEPFGNVTQPLRVSWWMGQNSTGVWLYANGQSTFAHTFSKLWESNVTVHSGQNLNLSIVFPDDFPVTFIF